MTLEAFSWNDISPSPSTCRPRDLQNLFSIVRTLTCMNRFTPLSYLPQMTTMLVSKTQLNEQTRQTSFLDVAFLLLSSVFDSAFPVTLRICEVDIQLPVQMASSSHTNTTNMDAPAPINMKAPEHTGGFALLGTPKADAYAHEASIKPMCEVDQLETQVTQPTVRYGALSRSPHP